MEKEKKIFALIGVLLGIGTPFLPQLSFLSLQARFALGILCWAIIWWIAKVLPEYVTALVMAVLMIVCAKVPGQTVLSPFSGATWWLLLAAFGLSQGMLKSGLLHRISVKLLAIFPRTFQGQVLGLMAVGTATAPFIPSLSAKAAILAPLAMGISDSMGYKEASKQSAGLFLAMLVGLRNAAPLFISASVLGYAFLGQYPEVIQQQFGMLKWFVAALPWFLIVSVANYIALTSLYSPKEAVVNNHITESSLPPMSAQEHRMLLIMFATVILWITEPLHGVAAYLVAIGALAITSTFGILDRSSFRTDITWDSLVFIGIALSLSPTFAYLGIDTWVVSLCAPAVTKLASNPYLLITGIGVLTVLLRFVIVSELAFVSIFMVFLVPLSVGLGINPWVIGMAVYCLVNPWFVMYQNPVYMAAYYAVDGRMAEHSVSAKYCFLYILVCLLGLILSVPYWIWTDVFYLN